MLRCQILRFIFQSTLPREERQWMMRHGKRFTTFQSTLPREERLFEVKNLGKVLLFQSTLPREERHRGNRRRSDCYNFNPRSHERSDEVEAKRKAKLEISIHAPTRGATPCTLYDCSDTGYFNPRSHERSDSNIAQKICLFLYNTDNKYIIR